jgi:nucleoid-associated protein YgaU
MGKGLFGRKGKDDKLQQELEQAKKEAEGSKKALKDLLDQNVESKQMKAEAEKKAADAEKKIAELEAKVKGMAAEKSREEMAEARQKAIEERKAKLDTIKKSEQVKTHVVQEGETLSHIALKYYKHATPPYWKFLLEQNTEALKGNERNVRAGMELVIPELPEDLQD